jgi:hypothetical protein
LIAVWVKACQHRHEQHGQRAAPMAMLRGAGTSAVALSDKKIWPQMCSGVKAVGCPLYSTCEQKYRKGCFVTSSSQENSSFFSASDLSAADISHIYIVYHQSIITHEA